MSNTLIFNKKNLIDALSFGASCAGVNKMLPITDYIHIYVDGGETKVKIESNSASIAAKTFVEAEQPSFETVDVCVPADGLQKILATLTDYNVTLDFKDSFFEVVYGSGKAKFPFVSSDEFPKNFNSEKENMLNKCVMPSQTLKYIINSTKNFVGNDELRPTMMAVCLTFAKDGLEYCATDAHKMICEKIKSDGVVGAGTQLLIPKTTNRSLVGLVGDSELPLEIRTYEKFASFKVGENEVCFTLQEGKYPNYHSVIPASTAEHFGVVKDELVATTKRMENLASASTKTVVLECSQSEINIHAEDADFGTGGDEKINVKSYQGENGDVQVGFNAHFLNMCLSEITSHNVVININSPNKAVTFTDENRPDKTLLIMPVMING